MKALLTHFRGLVVSAAIALFSLFSTPLLSTGFAQGSLTPPGAPAPTMKSLGQIEPRTPIAAVPYSVTNSGSYYFTTNLVGAGGTNGITILADNVTLDLAGFALIGPGNNGIYVPGSNKNIRLRNGSIRGWNVPVNAFITIGTKCDQLIASDNGGAVNCGSNAIVSNCLIQQNSVGLYVDDGSTVTDCVIENNSAIALNGVTGVTVRDCTIKQNGGYGLYLGAHCRVSGCLVLNNGQPGIYANSGFATIVNSTISSNSAEGIYLGSYSLVSGCVVLQNRATGILINSNNRIVNNLVSLNSDGGITGSAGIRATGSNNRIEGNTLSDNNPTGISINLGQVGNVVIHNDAHNSFYSYSLGNMMGPFISTNSGVDAGAIITNVNPWANFVQ